MKIVLGNGTLIDGTGAAAVPHARVVMEDGRIVEEGRPDLLFAQARHARTRAFVAEIAR